MKKRLEVSVSGGRTSAFMAWWLRQNKSEEYDMRFIFANTTEEHDETYRFLDAVNRNLLGGELVCVEAVVDPVKGNRTRHRVVNFNEMARDGSVFESVIAKYGVPNASFPHCTRELKEHAIGSYMDEVWPNGAFEIAIGIRADEQRRVSKNATTKGIIYPLVDMFPVDKPYVLDWFKQFDWDLRIPEELGNCKTCWKKSNAKLCRVWMRSPEFFEFNDRMERRYGNVKPPNDKTIGPRVFFRQNRSARQMFQLFEYWRQSGRSEDDLAKMLRETDPNTCSESCEIYATEFFRDQGVDNGDNE